MTTKDVPVVAKRKPPNAGIGRKKGIPNKSTTLLKDCILKAAELAGDTLPGPDHGLVKYLRAQAFENPGPFMTILGKVIPLQIVGDDGGPLTFTVTNVYEPAPPLLDGKVINGVAHLNGGSHP